MTTQETVTRKNLDNQEFFRLRQATEKISNAIGRKLSGHLDLLSPLFIPRNLLGTYIKSSAAEDVLRSDKAFADLQELFAGIAERPFGLPKKLQPPLGLVEAGRERVLIRNPHGVVSIAEGLNE